MSMELHMSFSGAMPSARALDAALSRLGLPYRLADPAVTLETWSGYLPFLGDGGPVGVELDIFDGADAVRDAVGPEAPPGADRVASFRWGGDLDEMAVAFAAAAALASLVNGVVFEPEGTQLSVEDAVRSSRAAAQAPHDATRDALEGGRPTGGEPRRAARMRTLVIGTLVALILFYLVLAEFDVVPRLD